MQLLAHHNPKPLYNPSPFIAPNSSRLTLQTACPVALSSSCHPPASLACNFVFRAFCSLQSPVCRRVLPLILDLVFAFADIVCVCVQASVRCCLRKSSFRACLCIAACVRTRRVRALYSHALSRQRDHQAAALHLQDAGGSWTRMRLLAAITGHLRREIG